MGERGPTKKPTKFKVLEGNPGNRPLDPDPPAVPPRTRIPTPPRNMGKHGRREWRRIAKILIELGVLTDLDMTLFTAYCHTFHEYYVAQLEVTKLGTIMKYKRTGAIYQNLAVRNTSAKAVSSSAPGAKGNEGPVSQVWSVAGGPRPDPVRHQG